MVSSLRVLVLRSGRARMATPTRSGMRLQLLQPLQPLPLDLRRLALATPCRPHLRMPSSRFLVLVRVVFSFEASLCFMDTKINGPLVLYVATRFQYDHCEETAHLLQTLSQRVGLELCTVSPRQSCNGPIEGSHAFNYNRLWNIPNSIYRTLRSNYEMRQP